MHPFALRKCGRTLWLSLRILRARRSRRCNSASGRVLSTSAFSSQPRRQIDLQPFDHARGVAAGADAERAGLLDFEQAGDFGKDPRDVGVVHGGRLQV